MVIPYGKFRDKGQPIDNISNYDSTQEEIVYICDLRTDAVCEAFICHKAGDDQEGRRNGIPGNKAYHYSN